GNGGAQDSAWPRRYALWAPAAVRCDQDGLAGIIPGQGPPLQRLPGGQQAGRGHSPLTPKPAGRVGRGAEGVRSGYNRGARPQGTQELTRTKQQGRQSGTSRTRPVSLQSAQTQAGGYMKAKDRRLAELRDSIP